MGSFFSTKIIFYGEMKTSISSLNALCGVEDAVNLTDYAKIFHRTYSHPILSPSLEEFHLQSAVASGSRKIRFRATGHSMHGRSLPCPWEKLIATCMMNKVIRLDSSTLEVDCGVQICSLNSILNEFNCWLPVVPSCEAGGPSAAGYFLAGGIGEGSAVYGGFWENVEEVLWTDWTTNKSYWLTQADQQFWHISGSGGTKHGFLEKLRLKFLSLHDSVSQQLPSYFSVTLHPHPVEEPTVWWTIFCASAFERELMRRVRLLLPSLMEFVSLIPPRRLTIKKINRYPGFLNLFDQSLCALSIGGALRGERFASAYRATALIEEFCMHNGRDLVPYSSSELSLKSFL